MNFKHPLSDTSITSEKEKSITYEGSRSEPIYSPYDGLVEDTDNTKCDGWVQIAHMANNSVVYSNICGVDRISTARGMTVRQGDVIGYYGTKPIVFKILDHKKDESKIKPFFQKKELDKGLDDTKKKEEKKEKGLEDIKPKEKENKINTTDNEPKNTGGYDPKNAPKSLNPFLDLLLLPPSIAYDATFRGRNKKEQKEEEKLNEQLTRMKKLM